MTRPLRIAYPGAFYHITSRGNEKKDIYKSDRDRKKFLAYLESATERYGARIHVYCLMSNHYHLLMETPDGNLSEIMRHINGAYTNYYNVKRGRGGHLFQGRYRALLVEVDEYAEELSRYIHLNPVKAGIAKKPEDYIWSSYQDYIGTRKPPQWLVQDFILSYFSEKEVTARRRYKEFCEKTPVQNVRNPLQEVIGSTFLGSQAFIDEIKAHYMGDIKADRNLPALNKLSSRPDIETIQNAVKKEFSGESEIKQASLYLCHHYSGRKLKELGEHFTMGESGVSQASGRFRAKMEADRKLKRRMECVIKELKLSNV
jgi:REP element-mobilizing transposase RayT